MICILFFFIGVIAGAAFSEDREMRGIALVFSALCLFMLGMFALGKALA